MTSQYVVDQRSCAGRQASVPVRAEADRGPADPVGGTLIVTAINKTYRDSRRGKGWRFGAGRDSATADVVTLQNISLTIASGSFVSLVGPSGCGKSTLLKIMAGLETPDSGTVTLDNARAVGVGTVGYMPQRDLLLPWRNVLDNATLALEYAGVSRAQARAAVRPLLTQFGLAEFAASSPNTLSGGMKQRLALLRTILGGQSCLLLDEPFGALDALTRRSLQSWLLDLRAMLGRTIVLVTHDVDEAIVLSDRVIVLSPRPGQIVADITVPTQAHTMSHSDEPAFRSVKKAVFEALQLSGGLQIAGPIHPMSGVSNE